MSPFDTPEALRALAAKRSAFADLSAAQRRVRDLQVELTLARRSLKRAQAGHGRAVDAWLDLVEQAADVAA